VEEEQSISDKDDMGIDEDDTDDDEAEIRAQATKVHNTIREDGGFEGDIEGQLNSDLIHTFDTRALEEKYSC